MRAKMLEVEREKLLELFDEDRIDEEVLVRIQADLDLEQLRWSN